MKRILALLLALTLIFSLSACSNKDTKSESDKTQTGFVKPENYASVVLVTINPELKFYLDDNDKVLAVEPVNADAKKITKDLKLEGKEFKAVVEEIVTCANEQGFIKKDATVNFTITEIKDKKVNPEEILNAAKEVANNTAKALKVEIVVKTDISDTTDTSADETTSETSSTTDSSSEQSSDKSTTSTSSTSKPSTSKPTTSTPTTSNPTNTTPNTPTHTHSWGKWKTEVAAMVNKIGKEKRTCKTCSVTESRETTTDAVYYSFSDMGLTHIFGSENLNKAAKLLAYANEKYEKFRKKTVTTDEIYNELSKVFVLDSSIKNDMRNLGKSGVAPFFGGTYGYNEANDTFTFDFGGSITYVFVLGYIHNGGNNYTVYYYTGSSNYDGTNPLYKVKLEFNRTNGSDCEDTINGEKNKYLSFEKLSSPPSNIIK